MKINYLIAYDIRDPKRLSRVHYFINKQATALQHSVFLIKAGQTEINAVSVALLTKADTAVDDIRLYPLQGLDAIWVAGKQADKMTGLYPSFTAQTNKPSRPRRFINHLFGAEK